ncbi:MAG TPA: TetR/AcrR family transcriptional regulator [Solirubrobacteraceae bacterium]|jgi:AcrR family transcriptional regulator
MPTAPTRPALRARYARRRRDLVDAAAHVFAERGYHATSVASLLEATGLTAGALYHYVEGRDELLVAICDELLDPLLEQAREIVASDAAPEDQLRELIHVWLAHIEAHLDHMRVFQQERHVIEHDPRWQQIRAKRLAFEGILDGLLEAAESSGALDIPDRRLTLLALLGMVNYTPTWFRRGGRLGAAEVAEGYYEILTNAYRPDQPTASTRT